MMLLCYSKREASVDASTCNGIVARASSRLPLVPAFLAMVKNWPSVLAARFGIADLDAIRFRNGTVWRLDDLRPGLAVFKEVCLERSYDAPFRLDPGGTVLDLGANVGLFTLIAAKKLVPEGQVIAVEPHPRLAAILRHNLVTNEISNVRVIQAAAFTQDGEAELHLAPTSLGATIRPAVNNSGTTVVATVNLNRIVSETGTIDLLKADVEGAEWPIVFDSPPAMWRRIKRLVFEFHLGFSDRRTASDLAKRLAELGYTSICVQSLSDGLGYIWAEQCGSL
jgi:FkbM family methyltransferase